MYGDERPHDKTLKVNAGLFYFSFRLHAMISLTLSVFSINPASVFLSARACVRVCPCVRARLCVVSQQAQISLNAHCCKAAAECNLTLTL